MFNAYTCGGRASAIIATITLFTSTACVSHADICLYRHITRERARTRSKAAQLTVRSFHFKISDKTDIVDLASF